MYYNQYNILSIKKYSTSLVGDAVGIHKDAKSTSRRRSLVWNYFKYMDNLTCRCKLCGVILRGATTGNMARHLRNKHEPAFKKIQALKGLHLNDFKVLFNNQHNFIVNNKKCPWLKKYIREINIGVYQCDMCYSKLRMPRGHYGNMIRHFRKKHPYVYAKESRSLTMDSDEDENKAQGLSDNEISKDIPDIGHDEVSHKNGKQQQEYISEKNIEEKTQLDNSNKNETYDINNQELLNINDPDIEAKIKTLIQKTPERKHVIKSFFWNFFKFVECNVYCCLFCAKNIEIWPGCIANLKSHVKNKHRDMFQLIVKLKMARGIYGNIKKKFKTKEANISNTDSEEEVNESHESDKDSSEDEVPKNTSGTEQDTKDNKKPHTQVSEIYIVEETQSISLIKAERSPTTVKKVISVTDDVDQTQKHENIVLSESVDMLTMCDPDNEEKIITLCQNGPLGKKGQIKSCIWNFFKMLKDDTFVCLFCASFVKSSPECVGNLKNHMKKKHEDVFQIILKYAPEYEAMRQNDDQDSDSELRTKNHDVHVSGKGPWIKKHISEIELGVYQCNICFRKLRMPRGQYGNMLRHFKSKHTNICIREIRNRNVETDKDEKKSQYIEEISSNSGLVNKTLSINEFVEQHYDHVSEACVVEEQSGNMSDNSLKTFENELVLGPRELVKVSDPDLEAKIKVLARQGPKGKRGQFKSYMWKFFKFVAKTKFSCIFCGRIVSIKFESVSNLTRHIQGKHKHEYKLIQKYAPKSGTNTYAETSKIIEPKKGIEEPESEDVSNKADSQVVKFGFNCGLCDVAGFENELSLFEHIKEIHPDQIVLSDDNPANEQFEIVILQPGDMPQI